ncbi:hypothetical protein ONO23_06300 [Micromonospora noduli]|uniref:Uncharacterized protein n=1 Tax=Micromonospora noduli TaxID=709876 RepID=A0A328N0U8_9ACTN|nr:hypothetical protein [Micromonospora noduli]RAN93348.1 hypothetical protein LAH08_06378 [Micromonospora noduli]RAO23563.1 hypothetical protein ONO23_06300 [Micromonospora noduli]RAO41450.1 hypothetical protein ONO86_04057 [Micromonospora noduli]
MTATRGTRALLGVLFLAAATVGVWILWLGWDTEYTVDAQTGASSGPYEPWQVIGCVLTLVVLAALAATRLSPWLVAPVMTVAFTAAWSWRAASTDDSGLWVVGAVLVLVGMAVGSALVSLVGRRVGQRFAGRSV